MQPFAIAWLRDLLLSIVDTASGDADRTPEQEAAVNRLSNRLLAATAGLAACSAILTGCGSGQISQVADQQAAVNGMSANAKNIALRNVHLLATQTGDALAPGKVIPLVFVAANNSPDVDDKLVSVTSDFGTVVLSGDSSVPAGEALVVAPKGQPDAMGSATPPTAQVTLAKPITNGLSYPFTFTFEKAGTVSVPVPLSAGESVSQ
jgi:copper(I)-binding protein